MRDEEPGSEDQQDVAAQKQAIYKFLELLARDEGIRRSGLAKLLSGRLARLAKCWQIDVMSASDSARIAIIQRLKAYIGLIQPLPGKERQITEQRRRDFKLIVAVSFNITNDEDLWAKMLDSRRTWLTEKMGISKSTIQRNFVHALRQIAHMVVQELQHDDKGASVDSGQISNISPENFGWDTRSLFHPAVAS